MTTLRSRPPNTGRGALGESAWTALGSDGEYEYAAMVVVGALLEREGIAVRLLPGDLLSFEEYLAERRVTTPSTEDLGAYPDIPGRLMSLRPWPPDRGAACWCGSGRRYKQCCRPFGLGTLSQPALPGRRERGT